MLRGRGTAPTRASLAMHCPDCGYDLTGNVSLRCPECGLAFEPLGDPRQYTLPMEGVLPSGRPTIR